MKWLAFVLTILSVGIWQFGQFVHSNAPSDPVASGKLPRVMSLKLEKPLPDVGQLTLGTRMCVRLGWIRSTEAVKGLMRHQALVQASSLKVEEVDRPLPSLHWVIIPPQPAAVALRQFRELQRQGLDSYLVTEGENKNAISLGLFESRNAAISVLEEKKRHNLNVVLVNFDRNRISYALSFETEPKLVKNTVQAVEADYSEEFDFVEVNRCKGVATPEKNP